MIFFLAIVFFTNAKNLNLTVKSSLLFCINNLVPSIFIYMVFSSFVLYLCDFSRILSKIKVSVFNILGICKIHAIDIVLCSVCGFVSGAKIISEKFKKFGGNSLDFSNSVILSSNAGIGFLIGCVGIKIWNSIPFGIYLFLVQIGLSILLGKILLNHSKSSNNLPILSKKKVTISSAFCKAVSSTATTLISMCAFVVVFSCFGNNLFALLGIKKGSFLYSFTSVILEFSQGIFLCTLYENSVICAFMTGFCVGFGGLCVHFQIFSVCDGLPLDKARFVIFKFFHGILCGISSIIFVFFAKIKPTIFTDSFLESPKFHIEFLSIISLCVIIFALFFITKKIFFKILLILN